MSQEDETTPSEPTALFSPPSKRRARRGARLISVVSQTIVVECVDGERLWKFLVTPDLTVGDLVRKLKQRLPDKTAFCKFCIVHNSETTCRKLSRKKSVLELVSKWEGDREKNYLVFCFVPKTGDESSSEDGEFPEARLPIEPPPLEQKVGPSVKVYDKWGFEVTADEKGEFDEIKDRPREAQNTARWMSMLANFATFAHRKPKKVQSRFWKGVPQSVRRIAWKTVTDIEERMKKNPTQYRDSLAKEYSDMEQIHKDMGRTLTTHKYFTEAGGPGQRALADVLHAYACHDVKVGYCQGMGFIAALLLTQVNPEEAFHIMIRILQKQRLGGLYEHGFPLLFHWFYVLIELMKLYTPKVHAFLASDMIEPTEYASVWFQTFYIAVLPPGFVVRVWDMLLLGDISILFRVAITLLQTLQPKILAEESALEALHHLKKPVFDITSDQFMQRVRKLSIPSSLVERLLAEYQPNK